MSAAPAAMVGIWPQFADILHYLTEDDDASETNSEQGNCGVPGGPNDTPICRLQARLAQPDMFNRAADLVVEPTGNRALWWYLVIVSVIACVASVVAVCVLARSWFLGTPAHRPFLMAASAAIVTLCCVRVFLTLAISSAENFTYRVFVPLPIPANSNQIGWNYWLSSALPEDDVETLAAAGGGAVSQQAALQAQLSARAAAPYQGALTLQQARIKCKDATVYFRSQLAGTGPGQTTDPSQDADRLGVALGELDAATAAFTDVQALMAANALTVNVLTAIQAQSLGTAALQTLAAQVLAAAHAVAFIAPGAASDVIPSDPAFMDQAAVALQVATPKVAAGEAQYASGIADLQSLGTRLQGAVTAMRVANDPRYSAAIAQALAGVPTGAGAQMVTAVSAMTDDQVLQTDATLNVASALLDHTILDSLRDAPKRVEIAASWGINGVSALATVWCVALGVLMLRSASFSGTRWDQANDLLSWGLRATVVLLVAFAAYIQMHGAKVRYELDMSSKVTVLESMASALRTIIGLGGTRGILGAKQADFVRAVAKLDVALTYDVLTDKNAYAYTPTRISSIVLGGGVMGFVLIALLVLFMDFKPKAVISRMEYARRGYASPETPGDTAGLLAGGGPDSSSAAAPATPSAATSAPPAPPAPPAPGSTTSSPEWPSFMRRLTSVQIAKLDESLDAGVPQSMRTVVTATCLLSLIYYLVIMIMNESNQKDLYLTQIMLSAQAAAGDYLPKV